MRRIHCVAIAAATLFACAYSAPSLAASFLVSGGLTLGGETGPLPPGSNFNSAGYNPLTGELAAGHFQFPEDTVSVPAGAFTLEVTYQLVHLSPSAAMVMPDGAAMFDSVLLGIDVVDANLSGIPVNLGTCFLGPIHVDQLVGTGNSTALSVTDSHFVVPAVASADCGGYGNEINNALAGSNNAMTLHIHGNFTAPPDLDLIFADGFELP